MALRLRRGTDAERQLITPLEGELIYTTDTKILFIGDGVTQGGLQVTGAFPESIDDLADVDISSIAPEVGQVLTWNGEEFLPADTIGNGEQINADIIADDSSVLVDAETQNFQGNLFAGQDFIGDTFTGAFVGDGSQLTNLPIAADGSGIIEGSNYRINISADDSTTMVDTSTLTFTGNGSGLTNLNLDTNSIFDLADVFAFSPPDPGDVLVYNGVSFVSQKIQFIEGEDSSIMVDTTNNTFDGIFVGDGSGLTNLNIVNDIPGYVNGIIYNIDVVGDDNTILVDHAQSKLDGEFVGVVTGTVQAPIFGDDSSLIVDTTNNNFIGNITGSVIADDLTVLVDATNNSLKAATINYNGRINFVNNEPATQTDFNIISDEERSVITLLRNSNSDIAGDTSLQYGTLAFAREDVNGRVATSIIFSRENALFFGNSPDGLITTEDKYFIWRDNKFGIGEANPEETLHVNGNSIITGLLTAGSIKSTIVGDDSTILVDAVNNTIPGYVSISKLKELSAESTDFTDFQEKIALL